MKPNLEEEIKYDDFDRHDPKFKKHPVKVKKVKLKRRKTDRPKDGKVS